ncbi:Ubinuclein-2 [Oopsacas minuta]|uniref:Ubinuclein-2 n=1 Tax=Oopsacas minuta TaxID=111878 RepID=A0AAV7JZP9_9METZ|nr:Ubinuclein-2 [Oopsacas minuta]
MSDLDRTIDISVDLKDHMTSEGFPRVNFAKIVKELAKTPTNNENINGSPKPLPTTETEGKVDISRHMNLLQSRKTYKGIREQDFHEVAQGYDTDDSFVDDSEAHEDLAPFETKLEHGTFYVNFGKVTYSDLPHESSEENSMLSPPSPKVKSKQSKSADDQLGSSENLTRPNCIIEHDGYLITPPRKSNKKRKDSTKFNPKMVLKRSKSSKGYSEDTKTEPQAYSQIPPLPRPIEKQLPSNSIQIGSLPSNSSQIERLPKEIPPIGSKKTLQPQSSSQPISKSPQISPKFGDKVGKQFKISPISQIDMNTILLTKFSEASLLVQMELTQDCFTPAFYEKNDIHKFASQIPESLTTILQLFFSHIQVKLNNPVSWNTQESQFQRCLILGKIYACLKRKQDQALTLAIQNYLEHFFVNKLHSFHLILDTILQIIQNAYLCAPLQSLMTNIQPYIDRINENFTDSQDDKQNACKKRFKWSFGLKQLLGSAITAQIELEKNGFGVCQENFTNEQIILQFFNIYVLPFWPKGRMKTSKLYKVTLPFHEHFTQPELVQENKTLPLSTTTICTTIPPIQKTTSTKIGNWKMHMSIGSQETNSNVTNAATQAVTHDIPNDQHAKKHTPIPIAKSLSPTFKINSPKQLSAHPSLLNPELIPVASQMSISSLSKKSPYLKQDLLKLSERSPKQSIPKPELAVRNSPNTQSSYSTELDIKPIIQNTPLTNSYTLTPHSKIDMMPTCILPNQSMLLTPGNAIFANNYTSTISQTNEQMPSFNLINPQNFGQNYTYLQTYPETIIHLKPGSKESSPKNAKSSSQ